MSKLLKKFLLGAFVVAGVALAGSSASASYMHTMTLKFGMTNSQVMVLQQTLNMTSCKVAVIGVGSAGMETSYFGPKTLAAVKCFQLANGLAVDGIVGPITGARLAVVVVVTGTFPPGCSSAAGFSTTTGLPCTSTSSLPAGCTSTAGYSPTTGVKCDSSVPPPSSGGPLSGGETSISNFRLHDAGDTSINEGDNKVEVAEIKFDVDDADAELVRADLIFDGSNNTSGGEDQPWKVFDHVYLMQGSTVLADMSSSDKSDWDETSDNNIYRIRLSDVNKIFRENDNVTLTVAVDVASSVDEAGTDADWDVYVATNEGDDDGLRFIDSAGLDTFVGEGTNSASFSIDQIGAENDLSVLSSGNDPDSMSIQVDENSTSDDTNVFTFKLKTGSDTEDVQINEMDIDVLATDPDNGEGEGADSLTVDNNIVEDVTISYGGHTFDYDTVTDSGQLDNSSDDAVYHFEFDEGDFVVPGDSSKDVKVMIKFRPQTDNYDSGTTIETSVDASTVDAEGVDSGESIDAGSNTVTSEDHTLQANGLAFDFVSGTASKTTEDSAPDTGTFTLKYTLTAFGEDISVDKSCVEDQVDAPDQGVEYTVENGSTVLDCHVSSTADVNPDDSDAWVVHEGDTETFTLVVAVEGNDAFEKVWLDSINYDEDTTDTSPDQYFTAGLGEDNTSTDEIFLSAL